MRGRRVESPSIPYNGDGGAIQIMITILVVILLLVALGALPTWPYSRGWGYYPSSGLGLVVLVLVILLLLGRL
jgi:multisubunit Na+/H+ antiporter MnhB subunit